MPTKKISSIGDLLKCSATSRILVNGKTAGIVFPISPRRPIFVTKDKEVVYHLSTYVDEMRYLPNGSIETDSPWEISGESIDGQGKLSLKYLGIID